MRQAGRTKARHNGRPPGARTVDGAAAPARRDAGVDTAAIEAAVRTILRAIGEDPDREGLRATPRRVANMYAEIFSGLRTDPAPLLKVTFDERHKEMVVVKDIPFHSSCEHHLLPFVGVAHVGYIPNGRIVGLSKIARLVETLARRPQVQERLTSQIADLLNAGLHARGAAVVIEAEHLCMTMRGVRKPGSKIVTSATRGIFRENPSTRAEFMSLIGHG
ncbi:MAG TPA: GTP cyclohydrolase I FolE [bacterium]|nr:GTP cyclohydrolase I FolE [bacterium]